MTGSSPYKNLDNSRVPAWGEPSDSVAPFVPTPLNVVKKMLELAEAGPEDTLYDLGCGDGRILFTAIEEFNVKRAVGIDLNPTMVRKVNLQIKEKDLEDKIQVYNDNFFKINLTPATLVTLYLTTSGNSKLRPKFEEELGSGARVVSHDFPMNGWKSVKNSAPEYYTTGSHKIYLYRLPDSIEKVEKTSTWKKIKDRFIGV